MAKPKLNTVPHPNTPPAGEGAFKVLTGIIINGEAESPAPQGVLEIMQRGWAAKCDMDAAKKRLDAANDEITIALGHPCAVVIPGVCRATYVVREGVKIIDAAKLEGLLGSRMLDLVDESVSYKASDKLLEMAADGDNPMGPSLRALLKVTESTAITYRAEK